jgi:integrase/recombinase XerD
VIQRLTREELLEVLGQARAARQRDWLMILVAYQHALRASEVVGLTRDNFAGGYLTVQRLKGSLRTTQPLIGDEDPLLDEKTGLFDYLRGMAEGQRVFKVSRQHFWWLFQRYAERAGVPEHKRHPHVLRHTLALDVIDMAGVHNTKQYLGHKSLSSTGEYLKVTDEQASAAVAKARKV